MNYQIFNNKRQQAIGNTISLLWFGAKVYLSDKNPFYHFLKRKGVFVYCFETDLNENNILQLLSLDQINHNKKILFQELNQKYLINLLNRQIEKVYGQ